MRQVSQLGAGGGAKPPPWWVHLIIWLTLRSVDRLEHLLPRRVREGAWRDVRMHFDLDLEEIVLTARGPVRAALGATREVLVLAHDAWETMKIVRGKQHSGTTKCPICGCDIKAGAGRNDNENGIPLS